MNAHTNIPQTDWKGMIRKEEQMGVTSPNQGQKSYYCQPGHSNPSRPLPNPVPFGSLIRGMFWGAAGPRFNPSYGREFEAGWGVGEECFAEIIKYFPISPIVF